MSNLKLYRVKLRGMQHSATGTHYGDSYAIAYTSEEAYQQVRKLLDTEDIGFSNDRCLESVELVAEAGRYPECRTMLFLPWRAPASPPDGGASHE